MRPSGSTHAGRDLLPQADGGIRAVYPPGAADWEVARSLHHPSAGTAAWIRPGLRESHAIWGEVCAPRPRSRPDRESAPPSPQVGCRLCGCRCPAKTCGWVSVRRQQQWDSAGTKLRNTSRNSAGLISYSFLVFLPARNSIIKRCP